MPPAPRPRLPQALSDLVPPQNLEAEQGVLGSCLLDNAALHEVVPLLDLDDFYRDAHQVIYRAMLAMYEAGRPLDAITLTDELTRRDQLDAVGGLDYLAEVINSVPHAVNALMYAQIVREKSVARRLIEAANGMLRDGYSNNFTAAQLAERAQQEVFSASERASHRSEVRPIRDGLAQALERFDERERGEAVGISTGLIELDDDLGGGLAPESLTILGARPSHGKSALALGILLHAALREQVPGLLFSLEMSHREVGERTLCQAGQVSGYALRHPRALTETTRPDVLARIGRGYEAAVEAPLYVDDCPGRTISQIVALSRRYRLRHGIGLIALDYLQLVGSEAHGFGNRQEEISQISRRLNNLARELKVPVLALSQLNRSCEIRDDHRPRMSDLRESGAIEQDADNVMLLYRPEVYDPGDRPGYAELILGKSRHGPTGVVTLHFNAGETRFYPPLGDADPGAVPGLAAPDNPAAF